MEKKKFSRGEVVRIDTELTQEQASKNSNHFVLSTQD